MSTTSSSEKKKTRPKPSVTPAGIASYPKVLGKADTKFKTAGVWSIKLKFPSVEAPGVQKMIDKFEAQIEEAKNLAKADAAHMAALKKKSKKLAECDRSFTIDEDTGEVTFHFKMTASGISKKTNEPWTRKPAVFDAQNAPLDPATKLGSGSLVKVAYISEPFYTALGYGVSLKLEAVQVLKVVEWGQQDASSYGFEAEDADEEQGEEDGEQSPASDDEAGDEKDF